MNKRGFFTGFIKSKILLLLALFVTVLYLSNDFSIIDIRQTALIAAIGIDKADDLYEVSVQIAIPQATDQTASNNSAVLTGYGKTVGDALEHISTSTGWYTKLSFCNLIVLGSSLFDEDIMKPLDYFLRTDKIQDTARMCMAEKSAKEILSAKTPLDELSAFSVTKILEPDSESLSSIAATSLKEFAIGYYSESGFSSIPIVKLTEAEGESEGGNNATSSSDDYALETVKADTIKDRDEIKRLSEGGGEGDDSGDGGMSKNKSSNIFDATSTALLSKGVKKLVLERDETLVFNMLTHPISEASIEAPNAEYEGKTATVFLSVNNIKKSIKLRFTGATPVLELSLTTDVRLDDTDIISEPKELVKNYIVPDKVLEKLSEFFKEKIESVFEKTRAESIDVFQVKNRLYRTQNAYFENMKNTVLQNTKLSATVKTKSYR